MIASSDVDSARSWVMLRMITRPGTKSTPPPIPSMPADTPATKPTASVAMMSPPLTARFSLVEPRPYFRRRPLEHDQGRRHHEQDGEDPRQRPARHTLLQRGADDHSGHGREADQDALQHVDVPEQALDQRPEDRDQADRRERRPRGLVLLVAEPQDQQRDDHGASTDPEQAAERPRHGGDDRKSK